MIPEINQRNQMDAEDLLRNIPPGSAAAAFFDPQYRGVLARQNYGNEGSRQIGRAALAGMGDDKIASIVHGLSRAIRPSGHLFLWVDKYHLCEGVKTTWLKGAGMETVSMITWDKERIGMGYRARIQTEFLLILQKPPNRAKYVWTDRSIRDIYREPADRSEGAHAHAKPAALIEKLILATTKPGDLIIDPAAGGYTVLQVAVNLNRNCIAGDIAG